MSVPDWSLLLGLLFITMVLVQTLLERLPLSSAMVYLVVGYALGPAWLGVLEPDPLRYAKPLEIATEAAVLVSLFAVGLKMKLSLKDRRWLLPIRLASLSMVVTAGLIALVGVFLLGLPWGVALVLGGILAPTDPVLASDIQSELGANPDRVGVSLAGEGGLNDGTAFPVVFLGLGLLGLRDLGDNGWRWWVIDLLWGTAGGLLIGAALGAFVGWIVLHLRTRHRAAVGLDEFLALGLIAVAYGVAQTCLASGFLAVFAAGFALRLMEMQSVTAERPRQIPLPENGDPAELVTHPVHAGTVMTMAIQEFNEQLEKLAELAVVLVLGAMLYYAKPEPALWWFIPLLFLVLRPLAVLIGAAGIDTKPRQLPLISWFGIRGIGSVFYLMYAIHQGITGVNAERLISLTLITVAFSIVVHGMTALPLMKYYLYLKGARKGRNSAPANRP